MMTSAMAENLIREHRDAEELSLAGLHLRSLEPLVPLLANMPHLRSLDLSDNELSALPVDLSKLAVLEALDLYNNPMAGVRSLLAGLQSLPRLTILSVTLPAISEEERLILRLPALTCLNGLALTGETSSPAGPQASSAPATATLNARDPPSSSEEQGDFAYWNARDSAEVETLFADVSRQDAAATQEFFDYMSRVVQHVTCLTAAEDDVYAQEGEVLKARRLLYEFCLGDAIRNAFKDGNEDLGRQLQCLLRYESNLMNQYDTHWRRILRDRDTRLGRMRKDIQDAMTDIEALMGHLPPGTNLPLHSGAAPGPAASTASQPRDRKTVTATNNTDITAASPGPLPPRTAQVHTPPNANHRIPSASKSRGSVYRKMLTLRQLKEVMEGIYASKSKYDAKCAENHLPRETMEQHMYTYLNQKYGLRDIILEWATAIVEAVQRYAAEDNDVAVFGKILRNEVDEEFRLVQQHVRETAKELLRLQIKTKRTRGGVAETATALESAMQGTVAEDEWKEVVRYMYNAGDASLITSIIHQFLYRQSLPSMQRQREESLRLSPTSVYSRLRYKDFVRLLLDFQLDGHERFLERYVGIFRRHDEDRDGIVNEGQFAAMVRELDPDKPMEEVEALVRRADPYDSRLVTFSESIIVLNDELLKLSYSQHDAPGE